MHRHRIDTLRWPLAAIALALVLAGAAVACGFTDRENSAARTPGPAERVNPSAAAPAAAGAVRVEVIERGFEPPRVQVARGSRASIEFIRRSDTTCATDVVIESQNIRRELPLNQPVTVDVNAGAGGEIEFTCGMSMFKGAIVVQ
jgi:hypothetical protein